MYPAQPSGVTILKDLRYGPAERNVLDVFVPVKVSQTEKPVLLFVHGGGFFSGDKRWSENVSAPWHSTLAHVN